MFIFRYISVTTFSKMPTPYEIAEQIRNDIKVKLRLGFYKLKMLQMRDGTSRKLNSRVRKLFALVIKEDGTVFDGFIGCSKCFKVFKSSITVPSSGVYNHVNKCPKNQIKDEIVAEEEKNAKKSNSIWKSFTLALKPDGVAGLYCEQCKMILEPSMESHECLNDDKT